MNICPTVSLSRSTSSDVNFSIDHGYDISLEIKSTKRLRVVDCAAYTVKTTVVCTHPVFITGICIWCGRKADDDDTIISAYASAIPLDYIVKDMRLSKNEIAEIKCEDTKNLLGHRKLYLVLDLDHTLLHSIKTPLDTDELRDFLDQVENSLDGDLIHLSSINMVTKLRPYVRTFLEEANSMFKMYIYTRGVRVYANTIAGLLDPKGAYFGSRVIAREDCTRPHQKGLDVVLGQECAVVILDDKERVWPDHKENLICVEKYNYFSLKNGGNKCDGTLASVLEVLKKTHSRFFTEYDRAKFLETDVRKVLKMVRDECEP